MLCWCFCILCLVVCVCAGRVTIDNTDDFMSWARLVSQSVSQHDVSLTNDIDFTNMAFDLPIGVTSSGDCIPFSGVFNGNNHSIKGITMNSVHNVYKNAGLFCGLKNAEIRDLNIDETCSFFGANSSSVSPFLSGTVVLRGVSNKAAVKGEDCAGGLIAWILDEEGVDLVVDDCRNDGSVDGVISGVHGYAGILGSIRNCNICNITVSNTVNNGTVSGSGHDACLLGMIVLNTKLLFFVKNFTNNGDCVNIREDGDSLAAGLIGIVRGNEEMTLMIEDSVNNGRVLSNSSEALSFSYAGGLIAYIDNSKFLVLNVKNSVNNGQIYASCGNGCYLGGIIGLFLDGNEGAVLSLFNTLNNGEIKATAGGRIIGGIIGMMRDNPQATITMTTVKNTAWLVNQGNSSITVGGLIGVVDESKCSVVIDHGINNGIIDAGNTSSVEAGGAGIVGLLQNGRTSNITLRNCENNGTVSCSEGTTRGLVGVDTSFDASVNIYNCINKGSVIGKRAYGIADKVGEAKNIVNLGNVSGASGMKTFWDVCKNSQSLFNYGECTDCPAGTIRIHKEGSSWIV